MEPTVALLALLIGACVFALVVGVVKTLTASSQKMKFDDALQDLRAGELHDLDQAFAENREPKTTGWFSYWGIKAHKAGQALEDEKGPGLAQLRNGLIGAAVGYFAFPGGVIGLVAVPLIVWAFMSFWLGAQAKKRIATIDKQLPMLLSGLRSYLQAGSTPQQAIVSVADEIPAPLGDELKIVKQNVNVAVPLDEALQRLSKRVPSREMQFLASSIEIAVRSGANLEPQLETIEGVVAQRARVRQKLATAVASVRPTQIAASLAVPIFFMNSLREESNRAFWFDPGNIIFLVAVIFTTLFGLWGIRVLVRRVESM